MNACRVLLADDHALVRAAIRSLLQQIEGVEIVAEAGNGREAVALALQLRPDLAIMDVSMAEVNGIDATAELKATLPAIRVLVLSMHGTEEMVRRALVAGASGYIVKDSAPLELRMAIEAIQRGEVYVSSRVSGPFLPGLKRGQSEGAPPSLESLTARQRETLRLIAEGKGTKEIAFALGISVKTVESHRAAIMARLGIHEIAGLVIFAVRHNLVDL